MWLKLYLSFGQDHPLWAVIADNLMAGNTPLSDQNINDRIKMSPFLQTWRMKATTHGEVCPDIVNLFKTATEFNVRAERLAFSRKILRSMPMWYYLAADPKLRKMNHGKMAECLKTKHKIILVGDAEKLARVTGHNDH